MKTQPKKEKIKSIITYIILAILLLLIIFAEDIIKLQNKNRIGLSESTEEKSIIAEPNVPKVSAGMIPIKWDGSYWTITTKNDAEWYDYASGKPAYIMLNDGVYQSELIRDMEGKKLAEENIGAQIQETELGSIFMWIPRFAINDDSGEIKYIKDVEVAEEKWTIPELFTYQQTDETKPDFLLTGVWVEKDIDTSYSSKITEMNKEEGIYGFLAHTKATQITSNDITLLQTYVGAGLASALDPITDPTSTNRIILKIINEKNQDPIKAKGTYNDETGLITIQVTYTQYEIDKIVHEQVNELQFSETNGIITANTKGINLTEGEHIVLINDKKGNKKELKIKVISPIYVVLYTDGTLAFGKNSNPIPTKTAKVKYGDIAGEKYDYETRGAPWTGNYYVTTINFVNKISPKSISYWFYGCSNLTKINNIINLDTSNVTDMSYMFHDCDSLTSLDLSNLDTSNVTDMQDMFNGCSSLTSLDVSNFDTSNVTDMSYMFSRCSKLTSLDLSNFNTSNVTYMHSMFQFCSDLTSINLSSFNTSNVTDMSYMFQYCRGLTSINLRNFNTSNATDMRCMFQNSSNLKTIYVGANWSTSQADTSYMFFYCGTFRVTPI